MKSFSYSFASNSSAGLVFLSMLMNSDAFLLLSSWSCLSRDSDSRLWACGERKHFQHKLCNSIVNTNSQKFLKTKWTQKWLKKGLCRLIQNNCAYSETLLKCSLFLRKQKFRLNCWKQGVRKVVLVKGWIH